MDFSGLFGFLFNQVDSPFYHWILINDKDAKRMNPVQLGAERGFYVNLSK